MALTLARQCNFQERARDGAVWGAFSSEVETGSREENASKEGI
jgi:hypothetical protein